MSETTDSNPQSEPGTEAREAPTSPGWGWSGPRVAPATPEDPTLTGEPTVEVPPTAPPQAPPWVAQTPGAPGPWATPPGPPPTGPGYPPPPYGPGPGGPWSQAPWAGSPPWHWGPPVAPGTTSIRPSGALLTTFVAIAVAIAAALGVLIGHSLWTSASNASPNATSPFGNGGAATPGTGNVGPGQGSSASGGPADAAAIAKNVDPGLVDVNTSVSYQDLQGAGTGMVLTPNGEVLTNNHVVEGATKISVTDVGNGKTYGATVVGYDRSHDVAVLQLTAASGLQTVNLGDSSKVSGGEGVVAIGNANGAGGTPSYAGGSITATNQSITASDEVNGASEQLTGLFQTNADIISGDSGGPLVNSSGQVVGIDTASSSGSGGFQFQAPANQGYAIPINEAISSARKMESGQSSSTIHLGPTAFLGVLVEPPGSGGNGFGGIGGTPTNPTQGATIVQVVSGGPADQAGLQAGDTITSVDGHQVTSPDSLTEVMLQEKPNASVPVSYTDNSGQQQTVTVTLGSGPPQ